MSGIPDKEEKKKSGVLLESLERDVGGVDTVRFVKLARLAADNMSRGLSHFSLGSAAAALAKRP